MKRLYLSIETSVNGEIIPALSVERATPDLITSVLSLSKEDYVIKISVKSEQVQSQS